jgi:hypothetical protein
MFFKKRPPLDTPMDHFVHREDLSEDERSVLDVYLTGVMHALTGINTVQAQNGRDPAFKVPEGRVLDTPEIEDIIGEFLKQRPDMLNQPLGLCAVMAVLQRFPT